MVGGAIAALCFPLTLISTAGDHVCVALPGTRRDWTVGIVWQLLFRTFLMRHELYRTSFFRSWHDGRVAIFMFYSYSFVTAATRVPALQRPIQILAAGATTRQ